MIFSALFCLFRIRGGLILEGAQLDVSEQRQCHFLCEIRGREITERVVLKCVQKLGTDGFFLAVIDKGSFQFVLISQLISEDFF